ncbi:MAG: hypothetical protein A2358_01260 [Candidatus Staskawiczbacteria bacterium RIFOXYB1_FULL_37_44]|uniref:HD/PDEase domain-containing protein n=1 Tax=Candidatus Staskawiczbacteria bacterium RIFOXYB1_FULL_37_44 TaxID=1802223 RepID=A0A1G2IXJ0_9BACT|nr:MAG: hypothetical protein A2358_01260 [Candidatus Staskawiczbacteria bacterium RIFOXYB1_FULL_37_44]OGZ83334.1 MAG: hypothetical protein A2416_01995 [Candidatus Staskawiczbacteria bacterium RIFOXYC1_FULL_37_52]OGZ88737.1 MAG: hypothetical protein A2581_02935 [Candidatus Staskawiczbacteria bacterium RIFOXYD1_FULL_37_110]
MENLIKRIVQRVRPIYFGSKFYPKTCFKHALRVSEFAKDFSVKLGASRFISEAGGLLHDIGAAMYGRDNHHITGAQEATLVLLDCECPLDAVGPIVSAVYSHRGSEKIPFKIPEAKCVAAADAKDHFLFLEEVWQAQMGLGRTELEAYTRVSEELKNDWEKTDPEIKPLLDGAYEKARQKLLKIALANGRHKKSRKAAR